MLKSKALILATLFFILCYSVFVLLNSAEPVPLAKKPQGVPEKAFYIGGPDGGHFLEIEPAESANDYQVKVYHDFTGQLVFSGLLHYSGTGNFNEKFAESTEYSLWDGDKLVLRDYETLEEK